MTAWDVAVIGLGAMGSSALFSLALRGQRVIGIERFQPGHDRGSSHGESRMIRLAYTEDPAYVPLARMAYAAWRDFEAYTGESVLTVTGIIEAGVRGSELVAGSLRSAIEHDIPHEVLSASRVGERFAAFRLPADWDCVFQPLGGFLQPEKAIRLQVAAAAALGATVRAQTKVNRVEPVGDRVRVRLECGETVEAGAAVIAAGAWIADLAPELAHDLRITRQPMIWFNPVRPNLTAPKRMPVFFFDTGEDVIYGVPDTGGGVKAASHNSGGVLAHAEAPRAMVSAAEVGAVAGVLKRCVPAAAGPVRRTQTCLYTRSSDGHFILGPHPASPQIVLASPCSGHGFKFSRVIGDVLADLATTGETTTPIGLFDPKRILLA